MSKEIKRFYEFGPFRIDTLNRQLMRDGEAVPLKAKAVDTLLLLIQRRGDVVEKEELMKTIWPDSFVEEANLTQHIYTLRKALGDGAYIETFPRRGYRFQGEVREWQDAAPDMIVIQEKTRATLTYEEESDAPRMSSRLTGKSIVALLSALIAIVAVAYFVVLNNSKAADSGPAIKSIAVLPFRPLSADSADEFVGLGLSDALITRLGNINQLTMRPASAVYKYGASERDPVSIGRDLQVDGVVDGNIQRSGDRIRLTVWLVRVGDGKQLWTEKFDERFTDLLAVEDSMSARVAERLVPKLAPDGKKLLAKRYTGNEQAHELYLKGRYFWNKRTEQDLKKSITYLEQAIHLDPDYALAYSGLADAYIQLPGYSTTASMEVYPNAKAAAAKALELDSGLAEAHNSVAGVVSYFEWNWQNAEDEYRKALSLNPNYAAAHHRLGVQLAAMGRFPEALEELKRALELDPLSLITNTILGSVLYQARRYDEAVIQLQKTLELDSNFAPAHELLGHVYEEKGMPKEAFAEYLKWRSLSGDTAETIDAMKKAYDGSGLNGFYRVRLKMLHELVEEGGIQLTDIASIYAYLGQKEQSLQWLEKAVRQHEGEVIWLKVLPAFDSLRSDPRFTNLLKRVNLT